MRHAQKKKLQQQVASMVHLLAKLSHVIQIEGGVHVCHNTDRIALASSKSVCTLMVGESFCI